MDKDWVKIFSSLDLQSVELTRAMLMQNNVPAIVLNKQDSSYNAFGEIELYVHRNNVIRAKHLINSNT